MIEPTITPIRVLLVDDDPLVCAGLRTMLAGAGDIDVVGAVADGAHVASAVTQLHPDVVLMDVRMPYVDGISATRALARTGRRRPRAVPPVIMLTTFDTDTAVLESLCAGAAGFLLKHTPPEQLVTAVRKAAAGEPVLSPEVARLLIERATAGEPDGRTARAREQFARLAEREQAVAREVAEGRSNAQIAQRLYLSVGTVKATISTTLTKLDLTNRIQLAVLVHDADRPDGRPDGRSR